jgi:hypothetical protein
MLRVGVAPGTLRTPFLLPPPSPLSQSALVPPVVGWVRAVPCPRSEGGCRVTCPATCARCSSPPQPAQSSSPKAYYTERVPPRCVLFSERARSGPVSVQEEPMPVGADAPTLTPPSAAFATFAAKHVSPASRLSGKAARLRRAGKGTRTRLVSRCTQPVMRVSA